MRPQERRRRILERLKDAGEPVTGTELAEEFDVSRQVIVQDIALLRAEGQDIIATLRGYLLPAPAAEGSVRRTFATVHTRADIAEELNTIVDNGGHVLDVVIEHPLYGELRGLLMVRSRRDVQQFVAKMNEQGALPLLTLTGGPHLHTVEAPSEEHLDRIEKALDRAGFLLKADG
jgi:hypothetical protein